MIWNEPLFFNFSPPHPPPGILKEPEPRPLFVLPLRRQPGILLRQKAAFRVRHEDGEAAIGGSQPRDPEDRAIGIGGIGFGGLPVVIDIAHGDKTLLKRLVGCSGLSEQRTALTVG